MNKYKSNLKVYAVFTIVFALIITFVYLNMDSNSSDHKEKINEQTLVTNNKGKELNETIPKRVLKTLKYIDQGVWPHVANARGTRGGDTWSNRDKLLPIFGKSGKKLFFKEWDVNPKKKYRSRDAERIITSNENDAWYTLNHYKTFKRIR